jgi:hypothetical protein
MSPAFAELSRILSVETWGGGDACLFQRSARVTGVASTNRRAEMTCVPSSFIFIMHSYLGSYSTKTTLYARSLRGASFKQWSESSTLKLAGMMSRTRQTIQACAVFARRAHNLSAVARRQATANSAPRTTETTASTVIDNLGLPDSPSTKHHDLSSFLQYAAQADLNPNSTTYVGTHFEYMVAATLSKYGFTLRRIGGASDQGIDLLGTWVVPSAPRPLKVLLQCKALAQKIGPNLIRELEGAFVGAPIGWKGAGVIGILVTQRPATPGIRESITRSKWPMAFISCSREGLVQQMLWNRKAQCQGLENLGVGVRNSVDGIEEQQVILTWKGKPLPFVNVQKSSD